jgi:hypothetical protein
LINASTVLHPKKISNYKTIHQKLGLSYKKSNKVMPIQAQRFLCLYHHYDSKSMTIQHHKPVAMSHVSIDHAFQHTSSFNRTMVIAQSLIMDKTYQCQHI